MAPIWTNTHKDFASYENDLKFRSLIGWRTNGKQPSTDYKPWDIFNCDETGLFWCMHPNKTYTFFSGEKWSSGKHPKECSTVLLCCNQDGSKKFSPLVTGKYAKPRAFNRLWSISALPVHYTLNQKSWMTTKVMPFDNSHTYMYSTFFNCAKIGFHLKRQLQKVFEHWLIALNKEMIAQNHNILLTLDNCPSHLTTVKLSNIKLVCLPPNIMSVCQTLDHGIIRSFKAHYCNQLFWKVIQHNDACLMKNVDILEAIFFICINLG